MTRDRYERKHRRTTSHPECVAFMAGADFEGTQSLAAAMGLEEATMNTIRGSTRNGDGALNLIARTNESTISETMVADYQDQYDYLEIQDRDVDGGTEYDVLDSWSEQS